MRLTTWTVSTRISCTSTERIFVSHSATLMRPASGSSRGQRTLSRRPCKVRIKNGWLSERLGHSHVEGICDSLIGSQFLNLRNRPNTSLDEELTQLFDISKWSNLLFHPFSRTHVNLKFGYPFARICRPDPLGDDGKFARPPSRILLIDFAAAAELDVNLRGLRDRSS